MKYLAHYDKETNREQRIFDHLLGTAVLAAAFAEVFGAQWQAHFCAFLHDVGKYAKAFQRRIRGSSERVDHATAGAQLASNHNDLIAAICIAGHHGGLPDFGDVSDTAQAATMCGRLKRKIGAELEDYSAYKDEITVPLAHPAPHEVAQDVGRCFFYIHMLYSCLVDADWLDTEGFYQAQPRTMDCEALSALNDKLQAHIADWWHSKKPINIKRCEILRAALEGGRSPQGLFSLTAPTGSGKTVASVAFALSHAVATGQRRIIYVIPYISILEQTKSVFEQIFGEKNVVAHYSDVDFGDDERDPRRIATENWDAPIILTTSVQFFESLFSNKPSNCRKLHNIANSVIIFDEAQMLPPAYLKPCIWTISQLTKHYLCSAVLCTATQPSLDSLLAHYLPGEPVREICPNVKGMHDYFARVRYELLGKLTNESLAQMINERSQTLCIVNSRKQARTLYSMIGKEGSFHLTTLMHPEHRRRTLEEIRYRLDKKLPCRVIATSLVEAGVDLDFPTVFRELAGLDSIIQAAGRCNRHGINPPEESIVYIFECEEKPPRLFEQYIAATRDALRTHDDPTTPDAIKAYFQFLYDKLMGDAALDRQDIMASIEGGKMAFATVSKSFKLIDNNQISIYIPIGEGESLVRELRTSGPSRKLMRKLGQYAVNVYPNHHRELYCAGALEQIAENAAILTDLSLYDERMGLSMEPTMGQAFFK